MARALGFGEFLDGDFARGGATAGFEGLALGLKGLDGFQEGGAVADFLAAVGIGQWGGPEDGLVAAQPGGEAGELAGWEK